jgi:hypothetical protein
VELLTMVSKNTLAEQIYILCEQFLDRNRDLQFKAFSADLKDKGRLGTVGLVLSRQNQLGHRIVTLFKAASLLVERKYPVEAAILILSMLESVTDILYIELDESRIRKWINHKDETKAPWTMKEKISSIARSWPEMEDYDYMFRMFSMVKHGNPVARLSSRRSGTIRLGKAPSWDQYLKANKLSVETGLLSQDTLRKWWKRKKRSAERVRTMRTQEKQLGEDILSDAGSLLVDAFASMVRYSEARFESERNWLSEWKIKLEQAHNALLGVRD